jgi:hypothetical protein
LPKKSLAGWIPCWKPFGTVEVGKIIVGKILEFVEANPNMTAGLAIGAAAGALVQMIPFIGPLLSPVAAASGAMIVGTVGGGLDRKAEGRDDATGKMAVLEDMVVMARNFFAFLADIFNALREYFEK